MAFVRVGSRAGLTDGKVMEAEINGRHYAVLNFEGEIRCFDGECPCTGGPLSLGAIRDGLLVCPWHGWRFDCKTGMHSHKEGVRVAQFPVLLEGDDILIDVSVPVSDPTTTDLVSINQLKAKAEANASNS
jgi:nitrite reductase/ring-hydroxylating ferredoxin subunit